MKFLIAIFVMIILAIVAVGCINIVMQKPSETPAETKPAEEKTPKPELIQPKQSTTQPKQTQQQPPSQQTGWQTKSQHPWQMFHGNYDHKGYANVVGPQQPSLKWKFFVGKVQGNPPNSVAIANDETVYLAGGGKLFALDNNGKEKWSKSYESIQGPAVSEDGSTIYFVARNSIVSVDKNGNEKWKFRTEKETYFGPTIGPDGTIYQGSWDSYFYALNPEGSLKWKYKTNGAVSYPVSIDKDGTVYLGGGDAHAGPDSNLYAFDANGNLKWKYDTKSNRVGSPAIGFDGLIYAPASPVLFVLDKDGNLKWKLGPEVSMQQVTGNEVLGPPPGEEKKEILGKDSGGQQTGNQSTSQQTSTQQTQSVPQNKQEIAGIITPAIGPDGTIYIGNSQGVISAIDPQSQKLKWTFQTGADTEQANFYGLPSFPVVDNQGTVYIGSVDGKMYAIDKNGQKKWEYKTGGHVTEAASAFDKEGNLYFTSEDGHLYVMGK